MATEKPLGEIEIANGKHRSVQCGMETGALKSITVETLDPDSGNSNSRVCITFVAEQQNSPDEDETAMFFLTWDELDSLVHMLQRAAR
jgi:hypothetical protein